MRPCLAYVYSNSNANNSEKKIWIFFNVFNVPVVLGPVSVGCIGTLEFVPCVNDQVIVVGFYHDSALWAVGQTFVIDVAGAGSRGELLLIERERKKEGDLSILLGVHLLSHGRSVGKVDG